MNSFGKYPWDHAGPLSVASYHRKTGTQLFGKKETEMKTLATHLSVTVLAAMLSILALASPAAANDLTYSFTLNGPQAAGDPGTGNTILVTGSGSFDTSAPGTVIGSGSLPEPSPREAEGCPGTCGASPVCHVDCLL